MALTLAEGAKLSNDMLLQGVVETIVKESPVLRALPFIEIVGNGLTYNQENALPSIDFYDVGDTWTESTPTFTQKTANLKIMGGDADVDNFLKATRSNLQDLEAAVVELKAKALRNKFEDTFIYGDASASPKQFDGLRKLIPGGQVVVAGANGAPLTLDLLDSAIDLNRGNPGMLIMSKKANRKLNSLLQAQQRFVDTMEVKGGFRVQVYNGIPIFRSIWVSDTQTQGTASNATDIYILDTSAVWIGDLTPLRMLPLPQKSSQGSELDIDEDLVLVLANDIKASRLAGVTL